MKVGEFREIVRLALRSDADDFNSLDIDRVARRTLTTVITTTHCTRTSGAVSLVADTPAVSLASIDGFSQERLIQAEVGYHDAGTWAAAHGPYAVNDLVKGDGDPDRKLYVCVLAHTAAVDKEPPNSTYWSQVLWSRGSVLGEVSDDNIRDLYLGKMVEPIGPVKLPGGWWSETSTPGRPCYWGFSDALTANVWPTPDIAYPLHVQFWAPLVDWTAGEDTDVDFNVPDELCECAAWLGAPCLLNAPDPDAAVAMPAYQSFLAEVRQLNGQVRVKPAMRYRRPTNGLT